MSVTNPNPILEGVYFTPLVITAAAVNSGVNSIFPTAKSVVVSGVTTDANDWITLPSLADVPNGHEITILCSAGSNFEMRTPTSSNQKINNVDSDGTQEYLMTDTQVVKVVKISTTVGWMAYGYSAIGAAVTAVIPD